MTQVHPLDPNRHRTHGWKRHDHYRFAAKDAWAPLLIAELPAALAVYPLAFAPNSEGGYQLVALQGLHEGQNLLVTPDGRWAAGYTPSHYRGYPFSLQRLRPEAKGHEKQQWVLCFDHASRLYRERPDHDRGEQRFFDDRGEPTRLMARLLSFLKQTASNRELTDRAVAVLERAGLLVDWSLPVESPDAERPLLAGLKRVDQPALNALSAADLAKLRDTNALPLAYGQLFSQSRLGVLKKFAALHAEYAARRAQAAPENLGCLFGEGDDDLEFDFER